MFFVGGLATLAYGLAAPAEKPEICETQSSEGGDAAEEAEGFSVEIRDGERLCAELRPARESDATELFLVRRSPSPTFVFGLEARPDMGGTLLRVTNHTGEPVRVDVETHAPSAGEWSEEDSLLVAPWKTRVEVYPGLRDRARLTLFDRAAPEAAEARDPGASRSHFRSAALDRFAFWFPVLGVRTMDFSSVLPELLGRGYEQPPGNLFFGGGGAEVSYHRFAFHFDVSGDIVALREAATGAASRLTSIRAILAVGYDVYNFGGLSVTPFVGLGVDETNVVTLRGVETPALALIPNRQDVRRSAFLGQVGVSTAMHLWALEDERDHGLALTLGFRGGYTHQFGDGTPWRTRAQSELEGDATFVASGAFFQVMLGGSFFLVQP